MARRTASNQLLGADQAMKNDELLRAHTLTAAYAGKEEQTKGSLDPGKLADLVVWTQDPYGLYPKDLQNATVDLTMIGGGVVFNRVHTARRHLDRAGS